MEFEPLSKREEEIASATVDAAYVVLKHLGPGLLERIYEVCLCHEFSKRGFQLERQSGIPIS